MFKLCYLLLLSPTCHSLFIIIARNDEPIVVHKHRLEPRPFDVQVEMLLGQRDLVARGDLFANRLQIEYAHEPPERLGLVHRRLIDSLPPDDARRPLYAR